MLKIIERWEHNVL